MLKENKKAVALIMLSAVIFGLIFWFFDAALEYFYIRDYFHSLIYYYPDSFLESIILNVSTFSLYTRLLFLFGCIAGGSVVAFYVSRRLDAERALALSEEQLKAIINSSFDAMVLMDREGSILKANEEALRYFKKTEEELTGGKIYEFLSGERCEKRRDQFLDVIKNKNPLQFDEEFDGRFYRLIVFPVKNRAGEVSAVAVTLRDTSSERKAERAIRESREYLALAMRSAGISIWEQWEKEKRMIVFSPDDILDDFEKKKEENRYSEFWASIHPDDRNVIGDALKDHFEGRTETYSALYRVKAPGEGWRWINSFGKVIERDDEGIAEKMIGIRVDVTNLHNYREAVIKANEKLNLLSEITRHDILNQVTAIRLSEEILLSEDHITKSSDAWDLFEVIFKATSMIEKQISFTKDYQNLGIESPGWQKVSVVMRDIEKEANLMNIAVTDNTGGLEIYADPMFEKVLFNILDNSSRHGGAKNLRAGYEVSGDVCMLILEDDGTGIEDKWKDMIFNRGFGKNTGIGLFLAREILDITGIGIRETGKPGEGARFEILIPKEAYRIVKE